jgi:transcriptional regulator with XRE-family HTH domain
VREKRSRQGLSQKELADRVGSTQPRVARLEQAEASLDAILRAVFALGASRDEVGRIVARRSKSARRRRAASHAEREVVKRPKRPLRRSA